MLNCTCISTAGASSASWVAMEASLLPLLVIVERFGYQTWYRVSPPLYVALYPAVQYIYNSDYLRYVYCGSICIYIAGWRTPIARSRLTEIPTSIEDG